MTSATDGKKRKDKDRDGHRDDGEKSSKKRKKDKDRKKHRDRSDSEDDYSDEDMSDDEEDKRRRRKEKKRKEKEKQKQAAAAAAATAAPADSEAKAAAAEVDARWAAKANPTPTPAASAPAPAPVPEVPISAPVPAPAPAPVPAPSSPALSALANGDHKPSSAAGSLLGGESYVMVSAPASASASATASAAPSSSSMAVVPIPAQITPKDNFNDAFKKDPFYFRHIPIEFITFEAYQPKQGHQAGWWTFRIVNQRDMSNWSLRHRAPYHRVALAHMWPEGDLRVERKKPQQQTGGVRGKEKEKTLLNAQLDMCAVSAAYNPARANEYGQDIDVVDYLKWRSAIRQKLIAAVVADKRLQVHIDKAKMAAPLGLPASALITSTCKPVFFQKTTEAKGVEAHGMSEEDMMQALHGGAPSALMLPGKVPPPADPATKPSFFWTRADLFEALEPEKLKERFGKLPLDDQRAIMQHPFFAKLLKEKGIIPNVLPLYTGKTLDKVPLASREIKQGAIVSTMIDTRMSYQEGGGAWGQADTLFSVYMAEQGGGASMSADEVHAMVMRVAQLEQSFAKDIEWQDVGDVTQRSKEVQLLLTDDNYFRKIVKSFGDTSDTTPQLTGPPGVMAIEGPR